MKYYVRYRLIPPGFSMESPEPFPINHEEVECAENASEGEIKVAICYKFPALFMDSYNIMIVSADPLGFTVNTGRQAKETNDTLTETWKTLADGDPCDIEIQFHIERLRQRIEKRKYEISVIQSRIDELEKLKP